MTRGARHPIVPAVIPCIGGQFDGRAVAYEGLVVELVELPKLISLLPPPPPAIEKHRYALWVEPNVGFFYVADLRFHEGKVSRLIREYLEHGASNWRDSPNWNGKREGDACG